MTVGGAELSTFAGRRLSACAVLAHDRLVLSLPDPEWYLDNVVLPAGPPDERSLTAVERWRGQWVRRADELARWGAGDTARARAVDLAGRQGFVLTTAQARAAGIEPPEQRRLLRSGQWCFVRRGVASPLRVRDHESRLVLSTAGAVLARPGTIASHESAALVHALPLLRDPVRPIVTARSSSLSGHRGNLQVHRGRVAVDEITTWFGLPLTEVARTVLDLARHDRGAGLVAADFALRHHLCSSERLTELVARSAGWPGNAAARWVVLHADPRAESPLETITRLLLATTDLPAPRLQAWIGRDRVDMLWDEQRVVLEADGRVKYGSSGRADPLWEEKLRQHRLEAAGYRVVRTVWAEVVGRPHVLVDRLGAVLAA